MYIYIYTYFPKIYMPFPSCQVRADFIRVAISGQNRRQIECQKECHSICGKVCQIECQSKCQKNVRINTPCILPNGMSETLSEKYLRVGITPRKYMFTLYLIGFYCVTHTGMTMYIHVYM